jgi:hypothetical protein
VELAALIGELADKSSDFRRLRARHDVHRRATASSGFGTRWWANLITGPKRPREVTMALRAYLPAMIDGDTDPLDDLLADGCTLTHVTGYVQPEDECRISYASARRRYALAVQV